VIPIIIGTRKVENHTHALLKITLTPSRDFQLGVSVIFKLAWRD